MSTTPTTPQIAAQRAIRARRRAAGLCWHCGTAAEPERALCPKHAKINRAVYVPVAQRPPPVTLAHIEAQVHAYLASGRVHSAHGIAEHLFGNLYPVQREGQHD